jgi:hypothetical protein
LVVAIHVCFLARVPRPESPTNQVHEEAKVEHIDHRLLLSSLTGHTGDVLFSAEAPPGKAHHWTYSPPNVPAGGFATRKSVPYATKTCD